MNTILIEPMTVGEVEEVSRLVVASIRKGFAGSYSPGVIEAVVRGNSVDAVRGHAPKQVDYVLRSEGQLLGMIGLKRNEIGHLFVHPAASGRGLGRALVDFACRTFQGSGYAEMVVLASLNAIGFYTRCGFMELGRGNFPVGEGLLLDYVKMNAPTMKNGNEKKE